MLRAPFFRCGDVYLSAVTRSGVAVTLRTLSRVLPGWGRSPTVPVCPEVAAALSPFPLPLTTKAESLWFKRTSGLE